MKSFLLIGCICAVLGACAAGKKVSEEDREMFKQMTATCKTSEKASDDDMSGIMDGKIPQTPEGKCFVTCVMKQFSMVTGDDANLEFCDTCAVKMAEMNGATKEKVDIVKEISTKCKEVKNADKCQFSADILTCIENEVIARKLNPDDF